MPSDGISSQDTSNQQEASDKQKPIDVEKTKQKLVDIDKQQTNFAKSVNHFKHFPAVLTLAIIGRIV
jgi:hypothetical protein